MRIIKEIEDDDYAVEHSLSRYADEAFWKWGFGDDGKIYWMGKYNGGVSSINTWVPLEG